MACLTNYTIQCTDKISGKKGCFFFDIEHWKETGEFLAIGPVYPDLESFYSKGETETGIKRQACYIERN